MTRRDLKPGQQASQLAHAARQFAFEHPELESNWFKNSNTIVLLSVESEKHLHEFVRRAEESGLVISKWGEPDYDDALTAVALEPGERSGQFCKGLPTALRETKRIQVEAPVQITIPAPIPICSGSSISERPSLKRNVEGVSPSWGAKFWKWISRLLNRDDE